MLEGFYGRPWTVDQRRHLFGRLGELKMNTYFYAPKDDLKHRAEWRILYTEDEAGEFRGIFLEIRPSPAEALHDLISSAASNNVTFVYAISPGIDISYSKAEEVDAVVRKLQQVCGLVLPSLERSEISGAPLLLYSLTISRRP